MMLRKIIKETLNTAFFFVLLCTNAFAHTAIIESGGGHKYKAVRLTPEIYNNANSNLSDILIKDENDENVPYLIRNYFTQEKINFIESVTPGFNVTEKEKITHIDIEGLKNLRLGEIIIDTDSTFKRSVRSPFGISRELYNLSFGDISYKDTAMPFDGQIPKDDIFTLTINNGDDKPVKINGITVRYYADELVFEGNKSGKYTIHFGADKAKTAPVYDIGKYKNEILKGVIDRIDIKEVVLEKPEEMPEQYDYKMIFNVVVVVVAVVLGLLILMKLKEKSS